MREDHQVNLTVFLKPQADVFRTTMEDLKHRIGLGLLIDGPDVAALFGVFLGERLVMEPNEAQPVAPALMAAFFMRVAK